jgi:hypothetical protein
MVGQSYIFDFTRTPSFFEHWNVDFSVDDMNQYIDSDTATSTVDSDKFEIVLVGNGGDNIDDYLDSDGILIDDEHQVTVYDTADCSLDYKRDDIGDATIELTDEVSFNIGDVYQELKAVLLVHKESQYVLGYSINIVAFTVTNSVVFDEDVIFWDITRLNNGG